MLPQPYSTDFELAKKLHRDELTKHETEFCRQIFKKPGEGSR